MEKLLQAEAFSQGRFLHRAPCAHRMATDCAKCLPVLLCTTSLVHSISQCKFVLQDLHKALCTTKFAQTTSQYYFVLQSLRKVLPSTTSARPSTTSYYKMCTKYVLVLLPAAKLAQRQFYIEKLYTRRAFNHNRFYTETLFTQRPVCPACWGVSESCASTCACSSPKIYFGSAHSPKERDQLKPFYKKERNASADSCSHYHAICTASLSHHTCPSHCSIALSHHFPESPLPCHHSPKSTRS